MLDKLLSEMREEAGITDGLEEADISHSSLSDREKKLLKDVKHALQSGPFLRATDDGINGATVFVFKSSPVRNNGEHWLTRDSLKNLARLPITTVRFAKGRIEVEMKMTGK
jgi:hypothetical protein